MKKKKNQGRRARARKVGVVITRAAPPTPAELRARVDVALWRARLVQYNAIASTLVVILLDAYEATVKELHAHHERRASPAGVS